MEHIQAALADVDRLLDGAEDDWLWQAGRTCRLEAEQVAGVVKDLAGATAGLESGSRTILAELAQLEQALEGDGAHGDVAAALRAIAETVHSALAEVGGLTDQAKAAAGQAHAAMKTFAELADDVAGAAGGLALDIQLIALNAEVQAAQVEHGAALEVLAHETCLASEQIGSLSEAVRREAGDVDSRLRRVSGDCARLEAATRRQSERLATDGVSVQDALRLHCDAAVGAVGQLREDLQALAGEAAAWTQEAPTGGFPEALNGLRDVLLRLAAECERRQAAPAATDASPLSTYTRRYTTREERLIHDEVLGESSFPTRSGRAGADDAAAAVASLQNPREPAASSVAEGDAAPLGDNVELF